jgi:hypothetical protein
MSEHSAHLSELLDGELWQGINEFVGKRRNVWSQLMAMCRGEGRTSGAPSDGWHNYENAEHSDELCALEPY